MKLNLWMIANRLGQYDIETKISPTTERTLEGLLPVSSLQSVYVRKEGANIVCSSGQGSIIIHGVTEDEGFLLIQSIFNWYDEWYERIETTIIEENHRRFIHLCAQAFENPVLFLDSNGFLAGMDCRGINIDTIPEWRYINEKGQISIPWFTMMSNALSDPVRSYSGSVTRFLAKPGHSAGKDEEIGGIHGQFRYQSSDYGTLTVLEKKRRLNFGDVSLLEFLTSRCSMIFAAAGRNNMMRPDTQIMNELLERRPVTGKQLDFVRSIITQSKDGAGEFCLFLFRYNGDERRAELQDLLRNMISKKFPAVFCWSYNDDLLAVSFVPDRGAFIQQLLAFIADQEYATGLWASVSLPFDDLRNLPCFFAQALFAAARLQKPGFYDFYECATEYLLETTEIQQKLFACEPRCRNIWFSSPEGKKNLETLSAYLEYERSSSTAAEKLFIHKNTLNYRIRNLKEMNGWDLEDPKVRDYLRLSIFFLSRFGGNLNQ